MKRILLINEDYNEQSFLDTFLKKVGFDILSLRSEIALSETLLSFKPDIILATGDGVKIKGVRILEKVKKRNSNAKVLLLFPLNKINDQKLMQAHRGSHVIETPVNPRTLISALCNILELPEDPLMQKFERLPIAKNYVADAEENKSISKNQPQSTYVKGRPERYVEILKNTPAYPDLCFSKEFVGRVTEEMRKYENANPDLKTLDQQRIDFVEKLFKKKR